MDEFVKAAGLADRFELLVRDTLHVIDQVLADRALKEPRVLQDHAEELVHILAAQVGRRHAVDRDAAAVDLEKRIRRFTIVVLPAPVGPTMATFWPGWTSAEKSLMMILSGESG